LAPALPHRDAKAREPLDRAQSVARIFVLGWALLRLAACSITGFHGEALIAIAIFVGAAGAGLGHGPKRALPGRGVFSELLPA
jgi:hypothetical protein